MYPPKFFLLFALSFYHHTKAFVNKKYELFTKRTHFARKNWWKLIIPDLFGAKRKRKSSFFA